MPDDRASKNKARWNSSFCVAQIWGPMDSRWIVRGAAIFRGKVGEVRMKAKSRVSARHEVIVVQTREQLTWWYFLSSFLSEVIETPMMTGEQSTLSQDLWVMLEDSVILRIPSPYPPSGLDPQGEGTEAPTPINHYIEPTPIWSVSVQRQGTKDPQANRFTILILLIHT